MDEKTLMLYDRIANVALLIGVPLAVLSIVVLVVQIFK
jgi:hypothetical protein